MKRISLREFRLHASKYIKELPIVLTVYDKDVGVLTHPEKEHIRVEDSVNAVAVNVLTPKTTHEEELLDKSVNTKCELNKLKSGIYCSNDADCEVRLIGENPESFKKITKQAWVCDKHFITLTKGRDSGSYELEVLA